jgi:DNA-directed RNA polymerase subunit RPC12/RpoP
MSFYVCPHCGEELDIPEELRNRTVRCVACREVFAPAAFRPRR